MRFFFTSILLVYTINCAAQKAVIDADAIKKWASINEAKIASNGAYALYTVHNQPIGKSSLIVVGINDNWKLEVPGVKRYSSFSSNSKFVFFKNNNDSLGIIETGTFNLTYIPMVQSHAFSQTGNSEWLVYQLKNSQKSLVLKNM